MHGLLGTRFAKGGTMDGTRCAVLKNIKNTFERMFNLA
jgi:hypothetical protein